MRITGGAPDPERVRSAAEFAERLQELKYWSALTYRELTARAEAMGEVLPRSTVANMLSRDTLPREELVSVFVRACGCGPAVAEVWLRVRKELAAGGGVRRPEGHGAEEEPPDAVDGGARTTAGAAGGGAGPTAGRAGGRSGPAGAGAGGADVSAGAGAGSLSGAPAAVPEPGAGRPAPGAEGRTRRWPWLVAAAVALALAGGGAAGIVAMRQDGTEAGRPESPPLPPPGYPRPGGPYLIRLAHSGLCLSERAEDETGQVFQAPCEDTFPAYSLEFEEGGRWRIATDHPRFGPGCTGIRQGAGEEGAPVEDDYCGRRGQSEEFRLERVAGPAGGYRLRPLHSGLCLSVLGGTKEAWTPVRQLDCGKDEGTRGQVFRFDPV